MSLKEDIEKVQKKIENFENQSFAMDLLKDYKKQNKRQFIVILVILTMWFATIGYLVYTLNDIDTIDESTTITQDNESGYNNYIGNDDDIVNGKTNN